MKPDRNIRLTLAFDGSGYHGWQIQKNHISIQGIVRKAIQTITGAQFVPNLEPALPRLRKNLGLAG